MGADGFPRTKMRHSFGKEIFLLNFLLLLDIDLWMDFGPDGQHGVEEEAPEDH